MSAYFSICRHSWLLSAGQDEAGSSVGGQQQGGGGGAQAQAACEGVDGRCKQYAREGGCPICMTTHQV